MGNLVSVLSLGTEESALVAELRSGSEEAFSWLINCYQQPIFSLMVRMVYDRDDAADLTQEVFIKVFRGIGGFHGNSSLRTWIYRIALREASNQRRWWMRHKQQEVPIDQNVGPTAGNESARVQIKDLLIDAQDSPLDHMMQAQIHARVEDALYRIPEPYRTTLILRDIEGFVYEEVAAIQGVNLGTVKSRLVRGRAILKTLLVADSPVQKMESQNSHYSSATQQISSTAGEEAQ